MHSAMFTFSLIDVRFVFYIFREYWVFAFKQVRQSTKKPLKTLPLVDSCCCCQQIRELYGYRFVLYTKWCVRTECIIFI